MTSYEAMRSNGASLRRVSVAIVFESKKGRPWQHEGLHAHIAGIIDTGGMRVGACHKGIMM